MQRHYFMLEATMGFVPEREVMAEGVEFSSIYVG